MDMYKLFSLLKKKIPEKSGKIFDQSTDILQNRWIPQDYGDVLLSAHVMPPYHGQVVKQ